MSLFVNTGYAEYGFLVVNTILYQHILFLLFIVPHLLNPFWAQGTVAGSLLKAVRDKEGITLRTTSSEDGGLGKRRMRTCHVVSSVVSVCSKIILGLKDAVAHPLKNN